MDTPPVGSFVIKHLCVRRPDRSSDLNEARCRRALPSSSSRDAPQYGRVRRGMVGLHRAGDLPACKCDILRSDTPRDGTAPLLPMHRADAEAGVRFFRVSIVLDAGLRARVITFADPVICTR